MKRSHWLPVALCASAMGITAACSIAAGSADSGAGGGAGSDGGAFGAGGGGAENGSGQGGSGNGKNIVEPGADTGGAGGGLTATVTTTTTTRPSGSGGEGGGSGGSGGAGDTTSTTEISCAQDMGAPRIFYMSSDDSNSMGSPALAREFLQAGQAPPPALIRPYEFLNYYRIRYDPLPSDGLLDVWVSYAPAADDGKYRLQVGVQSFTVGRPKMSLTFVVDTSSSLIGEGIERERAAVEAIASKLVSGDRVSFVVWANEDAVLLEDHAVSGPDDPELLAVAAGLAPGGGSDLHSGLTHGYALAEQTATKDRLSRVVLLSDGGANLGIVDRTLIAEKAKKGDDQGIYLVGVGVGPAQGYSDALMNAVTDEGRGAYVYVDSVAEATAVLGGRFDEVMDIAARAVEVKLTLPSYFGIESTSAEQVSTDKEAVTPQHLAPGDSMTFYQVLGLAKNTEVCGDDKVGVEVKWQAPALHPAIGGKTFASWPMTIKDIEGETWQMRKAEAIVAYANALLTRNKSDFAKAVEAVTIAKDDPELLAADDHSAELLEIADLLEQFPEAEKVP